MSTQSQDLLNKPVISLLGVGTKAVSRLEKLEIRQIRDLLFHLPLRYEDRTRVHKINRIRIGTTVLVCGKVVSCKISERGRQILNCQISDETGMLTLKFFHFNARLEANLSEGTIVSCFGEVKAGYPGVDMIHPEYHILSRESDCVVSESLTPIYPLTEGLNQATLRKAVNQALTLYYKSPESCPDLLPTSILARYAYPDLTTTLAYLHSPSGVELDTLENAVSPALKRLAFEEFIAHQLTQKQSKSEAKQWQAPILENNTAHSEVFLTQLPFQLTAAQQRVIEEIRVDCLSNSPMLRLVQGDVGSGKTVVAAYAALLAISSGYQVAIMAPTELLAEQHLYNFSHWFAELEVETAYLTSQLKGKKREQLLEKIAAGSVNLIIGTHALFQEAVKFNKLGLVVIDEQHRFGVAQRMALRDKGQRDNIKPHQLIMTATPIPRTLAMLNYADLDISIIDELPPGRIPVVTKALSSDRRLEIVSKIQLWVHQGRQVYWVCTLIEESEVLDCEAAEKTATALADMLESVRIGLVHGRMKPKEKEAVMQAFKNHELDVLVATTVIEVGVDVPNAGLMVIENPERLGLSQLHQLRGRVGRGSEDSFCLLMYQSPLSRVARERINIMRETTDGFVIAEKDLLLRGAGDMMGTRQTGEQQFKIANLERDSELLPQVEAAVDIIQQDYPDSVQPLINRWLGKTTQYAEV